MPGRLLDRLILPVQQIARGGTSNVKNIFVGNLSFSAREEELRALFEAHGAVERVSILTDRDTGRSRGFGFVEMTNDAEADRAIAAINGADLGGRQEIAQDRAFAQATDVDPGERDDGGHRGDLSRRDREEMPARRDLPERVLHAERGKEV